MVFLFDSSFASASFYPSPTKVVAFQIPATQLPESYTRIKVDCLHDRQSMHKTLFAAVIGLIAIISAIFKTVLL